MKLKELFAGVGSQTQGLKNLRVEHTSVVSEIDKYAIKSYNAIHGETKNLGDICNIEKLDYSDMVTYSFPCQDISVAGKQKGIKEGTRSGLLFEVERLIEGMEVKPKFLLLENVKNLVGKKFKPDFDSWLEKLEDMGYRNYWQVLNAKDYGIPQNRERVFCLSIRKDIDRGFEFPEKKELKLRLKDMLEDEVDEKFYLKKDKIKSFISALILEHYSCVDTKMPKVINPLKGKTNNGWHFEQQVYSTEGITRTIKAGGGSGNIPKILILGCRQTGRNPENPTSRKAGLATKQMIEVNKNPDISNCLSTVQKDSLLIENDRIRKLTPLECWRLMGFKDDQFYFAEEGCSNSQLYKQAGNSIVVDVLEAIFKQMIKFGYLEQV